MRQKRWAESAVRVAMKKRHRIRRAYEEIQRLNVETSRLHAAIRDEQILFQETRARLQAAQDPLFGAVKEFTSRRENINAQLLRRVQEIYSLPGYTGSKTPGRRKDTRSTGTAAAPDTPIDHDPTTDVHWHNDPSSDVHDNEVDIFEGDDEVDIFEGDEEQQALGNVMDFIASLSLS